MDLIKKIKHYLTLFQWLEVLAVIGFTIYFAIIDTTNPIWYLTVDVIAAISGIFCVVLCAAGKKSQYYWGFINIVAYIVVAWMSKYYGEVMLNGLYYLPTQFVGMYVWNKHMNKETERVKSKKMTPLHILIFVIGSIVCIWLYHLLLELLGANQTWLNSTTNTFALVANALMVLRYREQWVLWIVVDIITVIMWIIAGDWIMTSMWSVYLLNAFYGCFMWTKMLKTNTSNE